MRRRWSKDTHDLFNVKDEQEEGEASIAGSDDDEDATEDTCRAMFESIASGKSVRALV